MSARLLLHAQWSEVFVALETEAASAYILAPDLSLLFVNTGWRVFAQQNGAPSLADGWSAYGPITRAIGTSDSQLRDFFAVRLRRALTRNEPWCHTYECSSPERYRRFSMRARAGPGKEGLVVVHSLITEMSLVPHATQDMERAFTDARGIIVRCAACGRTARPEQRAVWEWVPGLDGAHNVSSGICATCSVEHYGFST